MKPRVKLFLIVFFIFAFGVFISMYFLGPLLGLTDGWKQVLFNAVLSGMLMAYFVMKTQVTAARKLGLNPDEPGVLGTHHVKIITSALTLNSIFEKISHHPDFKASRILDQEKYITASTRIGIASWGERIRITLLSGHDGKFTYEIKSRPWLFTNISDAGRNLHNVHTLERLLQTA